MYLFLSFLFYFGPALLVFLLTRKQPVRKMVAWTMGTEALVLFLGLVVSPVLQSLSWGTFPTLVDIFCFWGGESVMGLFVPALGLVVVTSLVAITSQRKGR